MSKLVNDLIGRGYLKTDAIIDAFWEIGRIEFLPEALHSSADANIPLPIGFGQTLTQPQTVAFMFELLQPRQGNRILDVGCGSGWTSALLAYIVGLHGHVTALEVIPKLCAFARQNTDKYKLVRKGIAEFHVADGSQGYVDNAPYDRILVSATVEGVPQSLKDQLCVGGRMVIPIYNSLCLLEKKTPTEFYKEEFPGYQFVPLQTFGNIS